MYFDELNGLVYFIPSRLKAKIIATIPDALSLIMTSIEEQLKACKKITENFHLFSAKDYYVSILSLDEITDLKREDVLSATTDELMSKIKKEAPPYIEYIKANPITPKFKFHALATETNIELCLTLQEEDELKIRHMAEVFSLTHHLPYFFSITLAKPKHMLSERLQLEISDYIATQSSSLFPHDFTFKLDPVSIYMFSENNTPLQVIRERASSPINIESQFATKNTFFIHNIASDRDADCEAKENDRFCCIM